jgi:putative PIN family toxin of toxin-antitoxin system
MKVLFDTNVYVSESLVGGLAEQIIEATIKGRWRIYVSTYVLDETQRILDERLGLGSRFAGAARQRIWKRSEPAETPLSRHEVSADPNDSPILKSAIAAGVDFLVSDDHHFLELNPYEGIRIVSMREYAEILRTQGLL